LTSAEEKPRSDSGPSFWRVAAGVFVLTVLVYWTVGPHQSGFDFQLSQANNLIHGHLDLTAEYTHNLGILERVLYDGQGFCLPIDDPRGQAAAANIDNPRFSADCRHYMQHSLGPAFLLVPLVAVWGLSVNQTLVSVLISGVTAVIVYALTRKFTNDLKTQLGLTALAMFGTTLWFSGSSGDVWHFAHATAVLFLFSSIYVTVVTRNPLLAGAFVGMAFLCRPSTALAGIFPLIAFSDRWLITEQAVKWWRRIRFRPLVELAVGVAPFIAIGLAVNYLRFGSPFESGYNYSEEFHQIDLQWRWPYGVLHPAYIPQHIQLFFEGMPVFSYSGSFVWPSWAGMAMWATSPALLYALFVHLKRFRRATLVGVGLLILACATIVLASLVHQLQLGDFTTASIPLGLHLAPFWLLIGTAISLAVGFRDRLVVAAWGTIVAIASFNWMFAATGWAQFGYRYGLDFMPFLFFLVVLGVRVLRWHHVVLIGASILVNLWGVLWIYQFAPAHLFGLTWVSF
jgi:hypothetical protein